MSAIANRAARSRSSVDMCYKLGEAATCNIKGIVRKFASESQILRGVNDIAKQYAELGYNLHTCGCKVIVTNHAPFSLWHSGTEVSGSIYGWIQFQSKVKLSYAIALTSVGYFIVRIYSGESVRDCFLVALADEKNFFPFEYRNLNERNSLIVVKTLLSRVAGLNAVVLSTKVWLPDLFHDKYVTKMLRGFDTYGLLKQPQVLYIVNDKIRKTMRINPEVNNVLT